MLAYMAALASATSYVNRLVHRHEVHNLAKKTQTAHAIFAQLPHNANRVQRTTIGVTVPVNQEIEGEIKSVATIEPAPRDLDAMPESVYQETLQSRPTIGYFSYEQLMSGPSGSVAPFNKSLRSEMESQPTHGADGSEAGGTSSLRKSTRLWSKGNVKVSKVTSQDQARLQLKWDIKDLLSYSQIPWHQTSLKKTFETLLRGMWVWEPEVGV